MNGESFVGGRDDVRGKCLAGRMASLRWPNAVDRATSRAFSIIGAHYGGDGKINYCLPIFTGVFTTGMPLNQRAATARRQGSASAQMPGAALCGQANLPAHTHARTISPVRAGRPPVTPIPAPCRMAIKFKSTF